MEKGGKGAKRASAVGSQPPRRYHAAWTAWNSAGGQEVGEAMKLRVGK